MKKLVLSITLVFILHKNYNVQYYSKSLRFAFRLFIFFVPVPPAKSRIDGEWLKDVGPSFSSTASLVDEDSGAVYHGGGCAKLSESNPLAVLSNDGGLVRYTNNNLLIYIYIIKLNVCILPMPWLVPMSPVLKILQFHDPRQLPIKL